MRLAGKIGIVNHAGRPGPAAVEGESRALPVDGGVTAP